MMFYPRIYYRNEYRLLRTLPGRTFFCRNCDTLVFLEGGCRIRHTTGEGSECGTVSICPSCDAAIYLPPDDSRQSPSSSFRNDVRSLPLGLQLLYSEARECITNGNYTASVLVCRKLLMNIAVKQGAGHHLRFSESVEYLFNQGHVPPNAKHWVDQLRQKGEEANHEIVMMTANDAQELIAFVELPLQHIYGFPELIPKIS